MASKVDAEVLSYTELPNGNVRFDIQYTLPDNRKIINPYHYSLKRIDGFSDEDFRRNIMKNMKYQCDRYIEDHVGRNKVMTALRTSIEAMKNE